MTKKVDSDPSTGDPAGDTGKLPPPLTAPVGTIATATAPVHPPFPPAAAALAGLTNSHNPTIPTFLDPTNALLAAVATSAIQQQLGAAAAVHHHQPPPSAAPQTNQPQHTAPAQLAAAHALLGAGAGNGSMNARTIATLLAAGGVASAAAGGGGGGLSAFQQNNNPSSKAVSGSATAGRKAANPLSSSDTAAVQRTNPLMKPSNSSSGNVAPAGSKRSSHRMGTSSTTASGSLANMLVPNMHAWDIQKLEQHVNLLHQMNQPVPQTVAMLLADARRKEEKRAAKRVANRKSACTSRARKKALVEEMTKTNARLKRQAMILSLLPDLVIAMSPEGNITFCSGQVERCLQYKTDELLGAKLMDLLVPASRTELKNIIDKLLMGSEGEKPSSGDESRADRGTKRLRPNNDQDQQASTDTNTNNSNGSGDQRSGDTAAAIVSEQSFPLSVVQVESNQAAPGRMASASQAAASAAAAKASDSANSSDNSTNNGSKNGTKGTVSSLTGTNTSNLSRSPTGSSLGEDADAKVAAKSAKRPAAGSGDDSSSSLSSDAKNMRKANDNLDRNVRWHNQRIMNDDKCVKLQNGPKDDVTGASVTANNATARLSSLQHLPEETTGEPKTKAKKRALYEHGDQSSSDDSLLAGVEDAKKKEEKANASDDSGYRESNDSREAEETSSSSSATSESNARKGRLVPTCRLCLIRDDMTTVWCEVTSSVRSYSVDEQDLSDSLSPPSSSSGESPVEAKADVKEFLLCLRPIRDGEKLADESLRFVRPTKAVTSTESEAAGPTVSEPSGADKSQESNSNKSAKDSSSNTEQSSGSSSKVPNKKPPKKRMLPMAQSAHKTKKLKPTSSSEDSSAQQSSSNNEASMGDEAQPMVGEEATL